MVRMTILNCITKNNLRAVFPDHFYDFKLMFAIVLEKPIIHSKVFTHGNPENFSSFFSLFVTRICVTAGT